MTPYERRSAIKINGSQPTAEKNMESNTAMEMPKYECHKIVHALKIVGISLDGELAMEAPFAPIKMPTEWLDKHNPEVGGYYVVYKDGYKSYSPAKAFEEGYKRI